MKKIIAIIFGVMLIACTDNATEPKVEGQCEVPYNNETIYIWPYYTINIWGVQGYFNADCEFCQNELREICYSNLNEINSGYQEYQKEN